MSTADGASAKKPRWRLLRRFALVLVLAAVLVVVALATGRPQHYGVVEGLQGVLPGTRVTAEKVGIIGTVRAYHLTIADADAPEDAPPAITIENLRIPYRPGAVVGWTPRLLPGVSADRIALDLEAREPGNTSYDFIRTLLEPSDKPSRPIPLLAVPERVTVDSLDISYQSPAMGIMLQGVPLDVKLNALDALTASVHTYAASGAYRLSDPPLDERFSNGRVDVSATIDDGTYRVAPMTIALPGIVDWNGTVEAAQSRGRWTFEANLERAVVNGLDFSAPGSGLLPVPFRFTKADLSGTHVQGEAERGVVVLGESTIAADIAGLFVGDPAARWYEGDLRVNGTATGETANVTAVLGQGQALRLDAAGDLDGGEGTIELSNWSRADIEGALPQVALPFLGYAPTLQTVSGTAHITWDDGAIVVKGLTETAFTAGDARLTGNAGLTLPRTEGADTVVTADLELGPSAVTGRATLGADGTVDVSADLTAFNVADAARTLGLPDALRDVETVVTGHVTAQGAGAYDITANVDAKPVPYITYPLPDDEKLGIVGSFRYDGEAGDLRSSNLALAFGSDATVAVSSLRVRPSPFDVSLTAQTEGDLGAVAGRFDLGPLSGAATIDTKVTVRGNAATVEAAYSIEGLGYGTLGLPFGEPLTGTSEIVYRLDASAGDVSFAADTGDGGTQVAFTAGTFGLKPDFSAAGDVTVNSDLIALRDMGFVYDAEGSLRVAGKGAVGPEGFVLDEGVVNLEAFVVELAQKVARVSGVAFEGTGGYGPDRNLAGRFGVARMEAAGAVLTDVFGDAAYGTGALRLDFTRGMLYNGRIHKGFIEVDLGEASPAITGSIEFREVDLGVFTEEFKPPGTRMTGQLTGLLTFAVTDGAMSAAYIRARAPEGFSINKDLIREQLLKQTINDATLGLLFSDSDGEEAATEQRYFDNATLEMTYDPGANLLRGEARMVSEELRLTMPMTVDMRVITEGLKFRQHKHLENVENVRLVPVELGE